MKIRSSRDSVVSRIAAPANRKRTRLASNGSLVSTPDEHVILFGAANPLGSDPLALGEECEEIERELRLASRRHRFRVERHFALTVDEFMRHLTEQAPTVCHLSGHGSRGSGLVFQDEQRRPWPVSGRALAMMIGAAAPSVRVVVLNACYTAELAEALRGTVDCVVGMDGAIGDAAARSFAIRYYSAIGNGRSIANAVAHGVAVLAAKRLPDELLPRCVTRDGIRADDIVLADPRR
jgi:CHAT domain-containing protein